MIEKKCMCITNVLFGKYRAFSKKLTDGYFIQVQPEKRIRVESRFIISVDGLHFHFYFLQNTPEQLKLPDKFQHYSRNLPSKYKINFLKTMFSGSFRFSWKGIWWLRLISLKKLFNHVAGFLKNQACRLWVTFIICFRDWLKIGIAPHTREQTQSHT